MEGLHLGILPYSAPLHGSRGWWQNTVLHLPGWLYQIVLAHHRQDSVNRPHRGIFQDAGDTLGRPCGFGERQPPLPRFRLRSRSDRVFVPRPLPLCVPRSLAFSCWPDRPLWCKADILVLRPAPDGSDLCRLKRRSTLFVPFLLHHLLSCGVRSLSQKHPNYHYTPNYHTFRAFVKGVGVN